MYKVGDRVRAVESMTWLVEGCVIGTLGVVRNIDSTWVFVDWDGCERSLNDADDGAWAMFPEQIELVERGGVGPTEVIASGAVTFSSQLEICAPIVVGGKRLDEVLAQYAKDGADVEIVVKRKEAPNHDDNA